MNKRVFTLLLLTIYFFSCAEEKKTDVLINGKVSVKDTPSVILCCTENGAWNNVDTCEVAPDGTFTFAVKNPIEGIWGIVSSSKPRFTRSYYVRFYLNGDKNVTLNVNDKWSDFAFTNELSPENEIFQKWNIIYSEMFDVGHQTYKDLYPKYDGFVKQAEDLKKEIKSKNKEFNKFMPFVIDSDIVAGMFLFKLSPNTIHPSDEEVHPMYAEVMQKETFTNDDLLKYPNACNLMSNINMSRSRVEVDAIFSGKDTSRSLLDVYMSKISSDKLKGVFFADRVSSYRTYEEFAVDYNKYGHLLWSDSQKAIVEKYKAEKMRYMKGQPAINFAYPDTKGKMVSLSDFKGKVVLVDVWATWCGPCKQQIPALKTLEKELHGKDIVFIGVSVDTEDKKQAWLDMVKSEGLEGYQLFTGKFGGSQICEDYQITGIPRFMIFDKQGNIYSVDAPRPTDPKLKEILLELTK